MSNELVTAALEQVDSQRRGFLRDLLACGAAVAALPVMTTVAFAAPGDQPGAGKGKGEGKGGAAGKGKGGEAGKGKGTDGGMPDPAKMAARMIEKFDQDGDKALNERELVAALTEMAKMRAQGAAGKGKGPGGAAAGKGKGALGGKGKGKGQN